MKKYVYLLLFIFLVGCNQETKIATSMQVTIHRTENEIELIENPYISVVQNFHIKNYDKDTLFLILKNNGLFGYCLTKFTIKDSAFMAEDGDRLQFRIYSNDNEVSNYSYTNSTLKIPINNSSVNITISYDYFSFESLVDYKIIGSTFAFVGSRYFQDEDAWYFEHDQMEWENVTFFLPPNTDIISNYPLIQNKNEYSIDLKNAIKDHYGIWFYVLRPDLLEKRHFDIKNTTINHYFQKDFTIDSANHAIIDIQTVSDELVEKQIQWCQERCGEIIDFFGDTTHKTIHVFMCDRKRGGTANLGDNNIYVVQINEDILCRASSFYLHELIHCYLQYPSQTDTSIYYLFTEGMTVYIDKVLHYKNLQAIDSFYNKRYNSISEQSKKTPLLYLTDGQYRDGEVAYTKGSYVIFQMAKRVGFEKFNGIIKEYYAFLRKNRDYVTLENFEQFLKTNGVSNEDWEYFISLLS